MSGRTAATEERTRFSILLQAKHRDSSPRPFPSRQTACLRSCSGGHLQLPTRHTVSYRRPTASWRAVIGTPTAFRAINQAEASGMRFSTHSQSRSPSACSVARKYRYFQPPLFYVPGVLPGGPADAFDNWQMISKCRVFPANRQTIATAKSPVADPQLKFCEVFRAQRVRCLAVSVNMNGLKQWRGCSFLRATEVMCFEWPILSPPRFKYLAALSIVIGRLSSPFWDGSNPRFVEKLAHSLGRILVTAQCGPTGFDETLERAICRSGILQPIVLLREIPPRMLSKAGARRPRDYPVAIEPLFSLALSDDISSRRD
jgi:hypothetical protein